MRLLRVVGMVAGLVAASLWAPPPSAAAVACPPNIVNITVNTSVTVPAGATCTVIGSIITGSITAGAGSTLIVSGSQVKGGVSATGADVQLSQSSVGASVVVSGSDLVLFNTPVTGSVSTTSPTAIMGTQAVSICFGNIGGNLSISNAPPSALLIDLGRFGNVECASTPINGSVMITNNLVLARVENTVIGGNLVCTGNNPAPAGDLNTVKGARVGQCVPPNVT